MESNVFLIKWYGPFKSREDLKEWEQERPKTAFYLYLFQGKRKNRKKYKYYCGMTYDRKEGKACVYKRLSNTRHHIRPFEKERPASLAIWVGTLANRSHPTKREVLRCENMIISEMSQIELSDDVIENATSKLPPTRNVYLINEWYDQEENLSKRHSKDTLPQIIPDIMTFKADSRSFYRSKILHFVKRME